MGDSGKRQHDGEGYDGDDDDNDQTSYESEDQSLGAAKRMQINGDGDNGKRFKGHRPINKALNEDLLAYKVVKAIEMVFKNYPMLVDNRLFCYIPYGNDAKWNLWWVVKIGMGNGVGYEY